MTNDAKITEAHLIAYRRGNWSCEVPPVTHAQWSESDWIRWIGIDRIERSAPDLFPPHSSARD